jgi:hypothetical protein
MKIDSGVAIHGCPPQVSVRLLREVYVLKSSLADLSSFSSSFSLQF